MGAGCRYCINFTQSAKDDVLMYGPDLESGYLTDENEN